MTSVNREEHEWHSTSVSYYRFYRYVYYFKDLLYHVRNKTIYVHALSWRTVFVWSVFVVVVAAAAAAVVYFPHPIGIDSRWQRPESVKKLWGGFLCQMTIKIPPRIRLTLCYKNSHSQFVNPFISKSYLLIVFPSVFPLPSCELIIVYEFCKLHRAASVLSHLLICNTKCSWYIYTLGWDFLLSSKYHINYVSIHIHLSVTMTSYVLCLYMESLICYLT